MTKCNQESLTWFCLGKHDLGHNERATRVGCMLMTCSFLDELHAQVTDLKKKVLRFLECAGIFSLEVKW